MEEQLEKDFREWWGKHRISSYNPQVDEHDLIWSVFIDAWRKGWESGIKEEVNSFCEARQEAREAAE